MTIAAPSRHRFALALLALISALFLAGCGGEGVDTSCGLDQCTLTFDRGAEAKASILGIEVEFVGVQNDQVTMKIAGETVGLTIGQGQTEVGGLFVTLQELTSDKVVIRVSRNP